MNMDENTFKANDDSNTRYGHPLKQKYFKLAESFTNMNHGSFGATPIPVIDEQSKWKLVQESRPDRWFRETYFPLINRSRECIAECINGDVDDVVLVENVSSAVNAVLRSYPFKTGDNVLVLSTSYPMVTETLNWLALSQSIEIVIVPVVYPVRSPEDIVNAVTTSFNSQRNIKLSIFSHISSMPTMIEPVKELTALAHSYGSKVIVDGAHAIGVLQIDVQDINAEFYTGNCHKWMYTPKGTAFLWVSKESRSDRFPEPTVISSTGWHDYIGKFSYTGTRDYSAFASIVSGFEFRKLLGGDERIYRYCHDLVFKAAKMLAEKWGTWLLVEDENMHGVMANVVLPTNDSETVNYVTTQLDSVHDIFIVARSLDSSNPEIFYTRISGQVYLEYNDFERLAMLVPELIAEYKKR